MNFTKNGIVFNKKEYVRIKVLTILFFVNLVLFIFSINIYNYYT